MNNNLPPFMTSPLSFLVKLGLTIASFFIVAFGQPAWNFFLPPLAACCGYALFWRVLIEIPSAKRRFLFSLIWFGAIQIVQYSWVLTHPYFYIYFLLLIVALLFGAQFGWLALWIKPKAIERLSVLLALSGGWVLMEWSRHFIFSGLPFNPVGLALTAWEVPLQTASLVGVYGLSYLVILTNLLLLRACTTSLRFSGSIFPIGLALFPYIFGAIHLFYHQHHLSSAVQRQFNVVLVQSALPIEEGIHFQSAEMARQYVLGEWKQVLMTLNQQREKEIDIIALPEYLVPFGTFYPIFPLNQVRALFFEVFGDGIMAHLPSRSPHAADIRELGEKTASGEKRVSNAYIVQALSSLFNADVIIGLEDNVYIDENSNVPANYSSAFHFSPDGRLPNRYDKRVLLPLGEYIPFEWCKTLAAAYGIGGSFTPGTKAQVFQGKALPMGMSICYEEIFGDLMRENKIKGAEVLINLTNDGWYPHSRLPWQHFTHAKLRTVENGFPLIRACNTGITGAIDSLGRVISILGEGSFNEQDIPGSLFVEVPRYHYQTLYSLFGDMPILLIAFLGLFYPFLRYFFRLFGTTHH